MEWDNKSRFFRFSFHATYFIFFPNECPGLCLFIYFSKRKSSYISGSHFIMRSKYYFLFGWSHLFPKDPLGQVFFTEDSFIQPWSIERKKSIRWVSQLFFLPFFCLPFFVYNFLFSVLKLQEQGYNTVTKLAVKAFNNVSNIVMQTAIRVSQFHEKKQIWKSCYVVAFYYDLFFFN